MKRIVEYYLFIYFFIEKVFFSVYLGANSNQTFEAWAFDWYRIDVDVFPTIDQKITNYYLRLNQFLLFVSMSICAMFWLLLLTIRSNVALYTKRIVNWPIFDVDDDDTTSMIRLILLKNLKFVDIPPAKSQISMTAKVLLIGVWLPFYIRGSKSYWMIFTVTTVNPINQNSKW